MPESTHVVPTPTDAQVHKAKLRSTPAGTKEDDATPAVAARLAVRHRHPADGVVAVKVQYPDAALTMQQVCMQ